MTTHSDPLMPAELLCYRCGYDLRAHPEDGVCPECGRSVAESRQWATNPRRPAWKDSDPRWRRRMFAGTWVLVLIPLIDVLQKYEWASALRVPTIFDYSPVNLNDTFLCYNGVYPSIVFCIGVVLLFSKERGRHLSRLDWTRRWGIICSYVVALLTATQTLFIPALVLTGISALCMSMPLKNQPAVTRLFVELSTKYLCYGPYPKNTSYCVLVTFSSITILLACAPLWEALCSSGLKRFARILLAPLAVFALMHIAKAGWVMAGHRPRWSDPFNLLGTYFRPSLLEWNTTLFASLWDFRDSAIEDAKWIVIFAIAIWLTVAQLTARRKNKRILG